MGKELSSARPEARAVFEEADDVLGFPLSRLCFEGPDEQLVLTENTQPALLAVSTAVYRVLEAEGQRPDVVAGHSLGEYSALVAAGSLEFADALRLVRERGRCMQAAVPVGVGAMAAVIGLDLSAVEKVCAEASRGQIVSTALRSRPMVSPANQNAPEQVAIAGHSEAVERATELATARGAKRVIPLPVSAPFHSALMKPAEDRMRPFLEQVEFQDLRVPLVNNFDARKITRGDDAREGLVRQIASMVRWTESVQWMADYGATDYVEVGPGRVLIGLIRRIVRGARLIALEKPAQVEEYVRSQ